jgi:diguanylate cyclase (GGDEF)-like protein
MSSPAEPEIKGMIKIVLKKRLREHHDDIEQRKLSIEQNSGRPEAHQGVIARGFLVDSWAEALRRHFAKTLSDLRVLLQIFEDLSSVECIRKEFKNHVDQVSSKMIERLRSDNRMFSSGSSERNTLINMVSMIKVDAEGVLNEEALKATEKERKALRSSGLHASELDDRLPLGRRGFFDRDIVEMAKDSKRTGEPLSLAMIDIDHFKAVNDTHGHQAGDEVLVAIAGLIMKRLGQKGKAYRYGGEEFAMLLPNYSPEEAAGLAERMRLDIEDAVVGGKNLKVTASFGIASFPAEASDAAMLVRKSDQALYAAKQAGRNCIRRCE